MGTDLNGVSWDSRDFDRFHRTFSRANYSQEETAQYKEFLNKIRELADSSMNQNVNS